MTNEESKFETYNGLSFDDWSKAWVDHVEGRQPVVDLPPFPAESIQKITNSSSGRGTIIAALGMYKIFAEEAANYGLMNQTSPFSVLDLGAGWGRITRLMLRDVKPSNLYAVDVDKQLVSSGKKCLPDVNWELIKAGKRLPFESDSFSLVLSNSVLSHLDEEHHMGLVKEVSRVLKPGGVFLGTTLSESHFLDYLKYENMVTWLGGIIGDLDEQLGHLRSGKFIYGHSNRLKGYGMTFLPENWANEHWAPYLDVKSTRTDYAHDVQVAQKL